MDKFLKNSYDSVLVDDVCLFKKRPESGKNQILGLSLSCPKTIKIEIQPSKRIVCLANDLDLVLYKLIRETTKIDEVKPKGFNPIIQQDNFGFAVI